MQWGQKPSNLSMSFTFLAADKWKRAWLKSDLSLIQKPFSLEANLALYKIAGAEKKRLPADSFVQRARGESELKNNNPPCNIREDERARNHPRVIQFYT